MVARKVPCAVRIVSDRQEWREAAISCSADSEFVPEPISWQRARDLAGPDAVIADFVSSDSEAIELVNLWADRGWQPIVIPWLKPMDGAQEILSRLNELEYDRTVATWEDRDPWKTVAQHLGMIKRSQAWLIPAYLGAAIRAPSHPAITRVMSLSLMIEPALKNVADWFDQLDSIPPYKVRKLLRDLDLPTPKRSLDIIRIARAADYKQRFDPDATIAQLAEYVGFWDGDYMAKRVRELAGEPPGRLFERSIDDILAQLIQRARKDAADS